MNDPKDRDFDDLPWDGDDNSLFRDEAFQRGFDRDKIPPLFREPRRPRRSKKEDR